MKSLLIITLIALESAVASAPDPISYQIGSEWSKTPIHSNNIASFEPSIRRLALVTAKIRGGTAFYLGKYRGLHVIATNHHVCPLGAVCLNQIAEFTLLGKKYKIEGWLGTFKSVDLTLMALKVPLEDEFLFEGKGTTFSYKYELKAGQKLVTLGFGAAGNPNSELVVSQDSDCIILSANGAVRLMPDPDTTQPAPDLVWSFANGCDLSHGDSGSPIIDRESGALIGLIWTGKMPKDPKIQSSTYVQNRVGTQDEAVWTEFSYAVPASKIPEAVIQYMKDRPYLTDETRATLNEIIMKSDL
jgi:hypothetical protein